jgi:DNA-binding transcriptional regulator YbjK
MAKKQDIQVLALSRTRILRSALELADKEGLEGLSMRKVAQGLGVQAMSLYNHVANKDDLIDGMVELVVGEMAVPEVGKAAAGDRCPCGAVTASLGGDGVDVAGECRAADLAIYRCDVGLFTCGGIFAPYGRSCLECDG